MSDRNAKNISYFDFFNSSDSEYKEIRSVLLEIPEFQRDYVWERIHIEDLIKSVIEADNGYYLGNIVTIKSSSVADKVVDGQQRLVTLSLIVKVLKSDLNEENKEKAKKLLFNNDDELRIALQKNELNDVYKKIIKDETLSDEEKGNSIYKAFDVIPRLINKEFGENDRNLFFDKIKALEFVVLKCADEEGAYQLFEGLNSTGLSLSAMELTKNAVLGKMKSIGTEADLSLAVNSWGNMICNFPKDEKSWPNKFLRHQWYSLSGYVTNSKLFSEIKTKKIREATKESLFEYLSALKNDAKKYVDLRKSIVIKNNFNEAMNDSAWRKIVLFLNHLSFLELDQIYSVLLSLNKYGKDEPEYFKKDRFSKHIERLWAFSFIMKYSSVSPSSYERYFANLCSDIHNKDIVNSFTKFKEVVNIFFKKLRDIADVKEDFVKTVVDSFSIKTDRDMLRTLCAQYLSDGEESLTEYTLEHIIPKGSLIEWTNIKKESLEDVEASKYKLGNLTLLKEDDVENKCFDYKFENAYKDSRFDKNKELQKQYGSLFNSSDPSQAVLKRGREIAEKIFDIYINNIYDINL